MYGAHCHDVSALPAALRAQSILVAHMGEHLLKGVGSGAVHLYCATTRAHLLYRFASLAPLRSLQQVRPCPPCAPGFPLFS